MTNPYRYRAPPGWNEITTAPRDTPIEIQNNWGVAPHYGLCQWLEDGWVYVNKPGGMLDGPHLSWRPYFGDPASYVDPTHGAQDTEAYWLRAMGRAAPSARRGVMLLPGQTAIMSVPLSVPLPKALAPRGRPSIAGFFRWLFGRGG